MDDIEKVVDVFPEGVRSSLSPSNIVWEMDWSQKNDDGSRTYPDKPEKEMMFESEPALAMLLINDVIILNSHWYEEKWPVEAQKTVLLGVNCSDTFAWGCSDAEGMTYDDIEDVYKHWLKDPVSGGDVWCMKKRRELPQEPVAKHIAKAGIWDLAALAVEFNLRPNHYDGVSRVFAQHKYQTYVAWAQANAIDILPFDVKWWDGWKQYTDANPGWSSPEWKTEDDRLRTEFRKQNGFEE